MIDLYTTSTPNGHKVSVTLEELELPYEVHPINLSEGDQKTPEFLAMNPNGRIPVIIDREADNFVVFESGAIMIYLAEKTNRFMPQPMDKRYLVIQWLMFQMGGIGPLFGQAHHFRNYAPEQIDYAVERYTNEAGRLYGVMDRRLGEIEYLAGEYSIADIAAFPWARNPSRKGHDENNYPNVKRWLDAIEVRPAVQRGLEVLADERRDISKGMDEETRRNLFGDAQYSPR